jgi:hypothetical protein
MKGAIGGRVLSYAKSRILIPRASRGSAGDWSLNFSMGAGVAVSRAAPMHRSIESQEQRGWRRMVAACSSKVQVGD